ncbi:MAG: crossover junction endodeoxyribonuclease RuvC, partial [Acidimicrobiia bacterium]|nr:crossover junction endodeoxyribonuclease RuvC [Acidimicrobiia bacterium]
LDLIAETKPQVMALERVFIRKNITNAMTVARASGIAMLAAAESGIPVKEYTPTAVKLAVAGDGTADKDQVASLVARRLRLEALDGPADLADALAVALCHAQQSRIEEAVS